MSQKLQRTMIHLGWSCAPMLLLLTACGGSDGNATMDQPQAAVVHPALCSDIALADGSYKLSGAECLRSSAAVGHEQAQSVARADPTTVITATQLFDWAEKTYPSLFPGPQSDQTINPYVVRYYPSTRNYIGVTNGAVYILGTVSGGQLAFVGTLSNLTCQVTPSACTTTTTPTTPTGSTTSGNTAGVLCGVSYNVFNSSASVNATSTAAWTCDSTQRALSANGLPDHTVGTFPNADNPNAIKAVTVSAKFPLAPSIANTSGTAATVVGYVLNGVKMDPDTGGTCNDSGSSCSLVGGTGNWRMEALGQTSFKFGTDSNNAHVQPTGDYHYHGMPEGYITKLNKGTGVTLIGWAGDGFPIYARYGYATATDATSATKIMKGSYRLKTTPDASRPATSLYPMGTFKQDYEYVAGLGDLDECNGRYGVTPEFPSGIYHYYTTDTYPYIQRCVKGTSSLGGAGAPPTGGTGGMPPPPRS